MDYLTGIIALVLGLLVSIALHELGHLIPAKRFDILCTQYFIGFGPKIFSRQIGETEVGMKWVLLGGYVKMVGMYAPGHPGRRTINRKGELTAAEEARLASNEEIPPGQEHRAFYAKPIWQRLIVMVSGTLVNLALSFLCVLVALSAIGYELPTREVATVSPNSPAAAAGVMPGDIITGWNGKPAKTWDEVISQVAVSQPGKPATLTVRRDGKTQTIQVTPKAMDGQKRAVIGVIAATERHYATWGEVANYQWETGKGTAKILLALPVKLWQTTIGLFQPNQPRDPNSLMGIVGMGQVAGSIAASDSVGYGFLEKLRSFLLLFGSLNMTLFMFNLIPLMPLDGGQAVGAIYEGIRKRVRRARGLNDGGPVDLAAMLPVTATVVITFIAMTVLLIVADILKPVL